MRLGVLKGARSGERVKLLSQNIFEFYHLKIIYYAAFLGIMRKTA